MTSSIDTRAPAPMPHLTLYGRDYVSKKRATTEAAFSDLKMIQSIAKTMTRKQELPVRKGPVSLNADARKQEIYRVMSENHKLLDRLETLEPVVSTRDLIRDYQFKQRYKISASHTKRLAGEYDPEIHRIKTEDQARADMMNRSCQLRMSQHRERLSNSMSMPSLSNTAPAASPVRPSPKPAPKRIPRDLGAASGTLSPADRQASNGSPLGAPQKAVKERQQMEKLPPEADDLDAGSQVTPGGKKPAAARVSFLNEEPPMSPDPTQRNFKKGVPTPHPKRSASGSGLLDEIEADEVTDEAEHPQLSRAAAAAAEPAPAEAEAAPAEAPPPDPFEEQKSRAKVLIVESNKDGRLDAALQSVFATKLKEEQEARAAAAAKEPEQDSDGFEKEEQDSSATSGFEKEDESGFEKEFDPDSESGNDEATGVSASASVGVSGASPKVGLTPTSGPQEKDDYEDYEEDEYEDDFADDTALSPTAGNNLSQAMNDSAALDPDESGTFEGSKDDSFEGAS